jgi:hypothetical protein
LDRKLNIARISEVINTFILGITAWNRVLVEKLIVV